MPRTILVAIWWPTDPVVPASSPPVVAGPETGVAGLVAVVAGAPDGLAPAGEDEGDAAAPSPAPVSSLRAA
ncbi:MAG: hypothetical protein L0H81_07655 [Actinomyces sp.]|nr:hypothetical protein [Actinomyces sp.]